MTPSFATSEGWNWGRPGSLIQRLAPPAVTPMLGTFTKISSTKAAVSTKMDIHRKFW